MAPGLERDGLLRFLESLDDTQETVTFGGDSGDAGNQKQQMTQLDFALNWLAKLPKIVPFGKVVDQKKESRARKVVKFNESGSTPIDPDSVLLAEEAEALWLLLPLLGLKFRT